MNKYTFETDSIGFYEHGIGLLRNNYVFDSIDYTNIKRIILQRGHLVKNWFLLLVLGFIQITGAAFILLPIANSFLQISDFSVFLICRGVKGYGLLAVIFILVFGIYCIVVSLKCSIIIKIYPSSKMRRFSLEKIVKEKKIDDFITQLREWGDMEILVNL